MTAMTTRVPPRMLPIPDGALTLAQFHEVFGDGAVPEGIKVELVDGLVVMSPSSGTVRHARAAQALHRLLADAAPAGLEVFVFGVDVVVGERSELVPDVVVVPTAADDAKRITDVPLLAVEVSSPSTRRYDRTVKLDLYRERGVAAYWLVDPDVPALLAYELVDGEYALAGHVRGDEAFTARLPYPVTVAPADLVRAPST